MTHADPGSGSPVDNPNFHPAEQPYEPQQGTGDAAKPQEEVDAEQAKALGVPVEDKPKKAKKKSKADKKAKGKKSGK